MDIIRFLIAIASANDMNIMITATIAGTLAFTIMAWCLGVL